MKIAELWRRFRFLVERKKRMEELDEEIKLHQDLRARALQANEMTPEQAAIQARRKFGSPTRHKESVWNVWSLQKLEDVWRDCRVAARSLRATPGFTLVAIWTLVLGMGATTAMFSVIDNVLIEPFPYAHAQRIYTFLIRDLSGNEAGERNMLPPDELLDYRERNRVFEDVMGVALSRATWQVAGAPESVNAPLVTANAFQFLGVPALLGRVASPNDANPGAAPVCVMSYAFWKSRFGGNNNVLGQTLLLDGVPRIVIGVMPPRFTFWSGDVWLPTEPSRTGNMLPPWYYPLGRLKRGLSPASAAVAMQHLAEGLAPHYRPNLYTDHFEVHLQSFVEASTLRVGRALYILLAAVILLLLIACVNVANLLLARLHSRRREWAVRTSLGAGWWRIVRQLFMESALLAALAAPLGCACAWACLRALIFLLPPDTFPDEAAIALNSRVLLATAAVTILTALFFGVVPVFGGLRRDVNEALRSGGYGHTAARGKRLRAILIAGEVAVSLLLLSAAGLTMRSFLHERDVRLGIVPQHLLTAEVFLTKSHPAVAEQTRFNQNLVTALKRIPGVLSVATTTDFLPFGGARTELTSSTHIHSAQAEGQLAFVDPALFAALKVPLLAGRNLNDRDIAGKRLVAVVNRALAKKFFGETNPVGQRIQANTLAHLPQPIANAWLDIVGVVADFKNRGVREPVAPEVFIPNSVAALGGFLILVRTSGDPRSLPRQLESAALRLDGSAVIRHTRTMTETLEAEVYAKPRFGLQIFAIFASLGTLLVSAGLYSVTAYAVSQRKREFGIRFALGATWWQVQSLVMRAEMRAVLIGIAAGLALSLAVMRWLASQLWQVSTYDPLVLAAVIAILLAAGVAACFVPSLGARRVQPAEVLRAE